MNAQQKDIIFLSLSWQANFDDHQRLLKLLNDKENFDFPDYIDSSDHPIMYDGEHIDDEEIKERLKAQLKPTVCIVIPAMLDPEYEDWTRLEIECANKLGKPILGIIPQGQTEIKNITPLIRDSAGSIVGWKNEAILRKIQDILVPPW